MTTTLENLECLTAFAIAGIFIAGFLWALLPKFTGASCSWRTTTLGTICLLLGVWLLWQNIDRNCYSLHRLSASVHYLSEPLLFFAVGWGLIHARDHRAASRSEGRDSHEDKKADNENG